jgi:hypothetical protein
MRAAEAGCRLLSMFLVVAIIAWALLLGLRAGRLGPSQHLLLLAGIVAAMVIQYGLLGMS